MAKKQEITVIFKLDEFKINHDCYGATEFTDETGMRGNGKNFESPVYSAGKVIWKGTLEGTENQRDFIHILTVFKKIPDQISLLQRDVYYGNNKGEVSARVRDRGDGVIVKALSESKYRIVDKESGAVTVSEEYNISFLVGYVDKNGEMNYQVCTIDPKIRMA